MDSRRSRRRLALLTALVVIATACDAAGATSAPGVDVARSTTTAAAASTTTTAPTASATSATTPPSSRTAPLGAAPTTTAPPPTTTATTTTAAPTTTTSTTMPGPTTTLEPLPDPELPSSNNAFDRLAANNPAASMTIVRDGAVVFSRASGQTIDGQPATADAPMVVASVSKIVTAVSLSRLAQQGLVDPADTMPWGEIGLTPDPAWNDVTIRELLDHRGGMPTVRSSWFGQPGDCASYLPQLVDSPPTATRGEWKYSNGNYCALGRLVEELSGQPLDQAAQRLVFDPIGVDGAHLTTGGQLPTDVPHRLDVGRLSRLGGAGTFLVSTDDVALMAGNLNASDLALLTWPGVFTDQYGWGHTGTVDGAKACMWLVERGRTAVAATIAGDSVSSGGGVCDTVVPAVASDLGIGGLGKPDRTPPP